MEQENQTNIHTQLIRAFGLRRAEVEALAETMTVKDLEAAFKRGSLEVNGRVVPIGISDEEAAAMIEAARDFWNRAKVD